MISLGVLGDLCRETESILKRTLCISRSIECCNYPRLKERLYAEIDFYRHRCLSIKHAFGEVKNSINCLSMQRRLLEVLLDRCLIAIHGLHRIY